MTPADCYHEALNSHRHYDSMANTALAFVGAAVAGGFSLYTTFAASFASELILVVSVFIIVYAVKTYKRFDSYAGIALNVAKAIENGDSRFHSKHLGFASVFANPTRYPDLLASGKSKTYLRLRLVSSIIAVLMLLCAFTSLLTKNVI